MRATSSIIGLLLASVLAACGSSEGGGVADQGGGDPDAGTRVRLQPLSIGDRWVYFETDALTGLSGTSTRTIEAFEDVGGMKAGTMGFRYHKVRLNGGESISWYGDKGTSVVIYRDQNFNAQHVTTDEEFYTPERVRVDETPEHTAANATWTETYVQTNIDPSTGTTMSTQQAVWTVEAVDDTVDVPAGRFSPCIRLRRDAGIQPKKYWFYPGVGKIKEVGGQTEELVSYSVQ